MLGRLILLIALFIAVLAIIQLLKKTPKSQLKNLYWKLGLGIVATLMVLLALTGRVHWITALIGATLPFVRNAITLLIRFFPIFQHYQKTRPNPQPSPGNCSQVETAILVMTLDHDNNRLNGQIISGPFTGHCLDSLNSKQLQSVFEYCQQQDQDSVSLLASYLKHRFGETWQNTSSNHTDETMGVKDAFAMLGLNPNASKKDVIQAHRKMMQKVHPDHGGSDFLAAQVNQAKELLLKRFT